MAAGRLLLLLALRVSFFYHAFVDRTAVLEEAADLLSLCVLCTGVLYASNASTGWWHTVIMVRQLFRTTSVHSYIAVHAIAFAAALASLQSLELPRFLLVPCGGSDGCGDQEARGQHDFKYR